MSGDSASPYPMIVPQGAEAFVVRFSSRLTEDGNRATLAFREEVARAMGRDVTEVASALGSVLVRFDPDRVNPDNLADDLRAMLDARDFYSAELPDDRRLWRIPAVFGGDYGPCLDRAADRAGLSPDAAVDSIATSRLRVMALGFAPGQPYLGELPEAWDFPRLTELIDVPEGAIVAAIRQLVLFANASPTGWEHVGQTAFRCFRPEAEQAIPLRPGDEVAFEPVTPSDFERIRDRDPKGGGAVVEALE